MQRRSFLLFFSFHSINYLSHACVVRGLLLMLFVCRERVFAPRLFIQELWSVQGRKGDSFGKQQRLAREGRSPDWVSVVDLKSLGGIFFFLLFFTLSALPAAPGAHNSFSALHEGRASRITQQHGCIIHPFPPAMPHNFLNCSARAALCGRAGQEFHLARAPCPLPCLCPFSLVSVPQLL